nr:putative reverse transcriptase domain-containing protein [Tanacetum cinerariifolium]
MGYSISEDPEEEPIEEEPLKKLKEEAVFIDLMNWVYKPYLDKSFIVFNYDILIYSKSNADHEVHLKLVLELLKTEKLFAKFSKNEFWLQEVRFLGHMVNNNDIHYRRRPTAKGIGLRVVDFHTSNHSKCGFTPLETIQRLLVVIGRISHSGFKGETFEPERRRCGLSAKELNEFLSSYYIPSEYDVILPTSAQTIFDAPSGYVGLYAHSFSLANLRLPFADFFYEILQYFKVHISRLNLFGCAKLTTFIIMSKAFGCEPSVDLFQEMDFRNFIYTEDDDDLAFLPKEPSPRFGVEEPKVQTAEVIAYSRGESEGRSAHIEERKYKPRRGSSRPPVKWKLAFGSSSYRAFRAKSYASKDDASVFSISDDDEVNKRAREFLQVIKKMRGEADVIKARERSREEECKELRVKCEAAMKEEHKEAEKARLEAVEASLHREVGELKQDKRDVVSKVLPYAAMELVHSDELGRLVGTLVFSAITYGCYRAYEQVATMKEPFNLSKAKGYRSSYKKEHT